MNSISFLLLSGICVGPLSAAASSDDSLWDYRFAAPGIRDGTVTAMKFDGSNIFVGGHFQTVGRTSANGLARFDGLRWYGFTNGPQQDAWLPNVTSLEFFQGNLYVGGFFTNAGGLASGGLAMWDQTNWSVPNLTNGFVTALRSTSEGLLVGGRFFIAGITNPVGLARWNGQEWDRISTELPPCGNNANCSAFAQAIEVVGENIFAILGQQTDPKSPGPADYRLAQCDAETNWSSFAGPDGNPYGLGYYSLAKFNGRLIAAGNFINPTNSAIRNIALWDNEAWQPLSSGLPGEVSGLAGNDHSLFAFYRSNGTNLPALFRIARWDGQSWADLDTNDIEGDSWAPLFVGPDDEIYLSGLYRRMGERGFVGLACWKNGEWRPLFEGSYEGISGAGNLIFAFHEHAGSIYAGGSFRGANSRLISNLARWDGSNWNSVGGGIGGPRSMVLAMTDADSDLIVAGSFTNAGGVLTSNIARWNNSNWSAFGDGFNDTVLSLAIQNGTVFAGGNFTASGNNAVSHIAKWNGSTWQPVANGCDDNVVTMAVWNDELYVGGEFSEAGETSAPGIAQWNGANWSNVGTGDWVPAKPPIRCIVCAEDGIYVAGQFTKAAGIAATNIARWDGQNWHPIGNGVPGNLWALAVHDGAVFVGGEMTNGENRSFGGIYRFDGTNWISLGTGVNDPRGIARVRALCATENEVFVSGIFSFAGTRPSANVARWIEKPDLKLQITSETENERAVVQTISDPGLCFRLESTFDFRDWKTIWAGAGGEVSREIEISEPLRFFRATADSATDPDANKTSF